jgi:hypothetical protein
MRVTSLFVLLGLTLVSPRAAAAQTSSTPRSTYSTPYFSKLFAPPSTPFFKPASSPDGSPADQTLPARQMPRVVCGMTMIPVDPSFDANIRRPVPPSGPKFTIKTVKPPLCGQ